MVVLGGIGLDLGPRGIETRVFASDSDLSDFADAMEPARFLFCGMDSQAILLRVIENPANREAIRDMLSRGGVIWFDDRYGYGNRSIEAFMTSLGAAMPGQGVPSRTQQAVDVSPRAGSAHPLNQGQPAEGALGYQCWAKWPKRLEALFVETRRPERAAVLLAEPVQQRGAVIYSRTLDGWQPERHDTVRPFIDNVLRRAFGPAPAPGITHPVSDPYRRRAPEANTAHLAGADRMHWEVSDAPHRRIFLVSESVGLARDEAYVEVEWRLPNITDGDIVRAVTAGGVELHAQRVAKDRFAFTIPLRPYDDQLVGLYVGGRAAPDVRSVGDLALAETPLGWEMRNDYFAALLAPDRPHLWRLRPFSGTSANILQSWGRPSRWMGNGTDFSVADKRRGKPTGGRADLVVDGPVRKTLRYETKFAEHDLTCDVTIVRGGRALFFRTTSGTPHELQVETGWSPGGSMADDALWYEAVDGLKQLPMSIDPASDYTLDQHAKETWYAIADNAAREVAGGFRERDAEGRFVVRLYAHHVHGQLAIEDLSLGPDGVTGGWVAARGGPDAVRRAYLEWRHPPVVTVGPVHRREQAPAPSPPVLGRDFLRMHGTFRRFAPKNVGAGFDGWGAAAVAGVRELGGNVVSVGDHLDPSLWPALFEEAARLGVAVCLKGHHRRLERQSSLRNVPTDLVFASHLEMDLPRYRLLVVPSGRVISDASVRRITDWVRGGGSVIVEGEALLTPGLAKLCGVEVEDGAVRRSVVIKGSGDLLGGVTVSTSVAAVPMRARTARVIGADGGTPLATVREAGKGRAVALALLEVGHDLLRPLVAGLGGSLPARVEGEASGDIRLSVHTDGRQSAIGVFNEHVNATRDVTVTLGAVAPIGERLATNVSTGAHEIVSDRIDVRLRPRDWNFILLDPVASPGPAKVSDPVRADAYAPVNGMTFLRGAAQRENADRSRRSDGISDGIVVSVFRSARNHRKPCDYGAEAMLRRLDRQERAAASWVDDVRTETLEGVDVLVIPNMADHPTNLGDDWQQDVRAFVERGGGVLLVHHSAGHPSLGAAPFPEIGTLGTFVPVRGMRIVAHHPVVSAASVGKAFATRRNNPAFIALIERTRLIEGAVFDSGFPDYMPIAPGAAGTVIARSVETSGAGGDPTLVAGAVGRGRVVLAGLSLGARCVTRDGKVVTSEGLSDEEAAILVNAVFWLGE